MAALAFGVCSVIESKSSAGFLRFDFFSIIQPNKTNLKMGGGVTALDNSYLSN